MEMTITRALAEKKMLLKRIDSSIQNLRTVDVCVGKKPVNGYATNEEFIKNSDAMYQSTTALIDRLTAIETGIANSNATSLVTICGKEMTMASAIKRKTLIKFDEALLRKLKGEYQIRLSQVERDNQAVQVRLDKLLDTSFTSGSRPKEEDVRAISTPFMEANEVKLVALTGLKDKIEALEKEIDEFLLEIDFSTSEKNSTNTIIIPD